MGKQDSTKEARGDPASIRKDRDALAIGLLMQTSTLDNLTMPKHLQWTPQLVARFWNGVAQTPTLDEKSFANLIGPILMEFMSPWIASGARCLDYGGGSGHLLTLMVKAGLRTAIFEPSILRAGKIMARMEGEPSFLGAISLHGPATFDFTVCAEVIEHISAPNTDTFMRSMTRRIAPDGLLFLTTPFAENLAASDVYCPRCDHLFHRWQHQRSWQIADIESLMKRWGLETEWLGRVEFDDPNCVRDFHLRRRCGEPWPWLDDGKVPLIGRGDHIVYIGRKPSVAMSLNDQDPLISAMPAEARSGSAVPIGSVLPCPEVAEPTRHGTIIVFPGSIGFDDGSLPHASSAFVFDGQWRRARPLDNHGAETKKVETDRGRGRSLIERAKREALRRMWGNMQARRLQPWFDRRENAVLQTLLSPGAFPYRLSHVVEGRVLLGVSTLGSGGAERQMVNTVQGLRARGVDEVHLLVEYLRDAPENAFYLDRAERFAAAVHAAPKDDYGTSAWALQHPQFRDVLTDGLIGRILNAASVIKRLAPEIVQTSLDWTNITVGLAAVLAGVPKVFISGRNLSPIYFEFFQWFMYPCYRALAAHPNVQILNNSDAGRHDYAKWLELPPERIKVLRNGLATDEFQVVGGVERRAARRVLGIADDTPLVVGAFRLSAEKRPLLWIETAAKIKARVPNVVFLLCGIGLMEGEVKSKVAALGLDSCFQHLGVRSDIQTIFSAADLVLQTSLQEGTPNTLIEAQAMGIPVVTTPAFGAAEAVEHGVTGVVVRDETSAGLADAAVSILEDAELRVSVRETGPKLVEARFGLERMVDETLLAYADAGVPWALDFLAEPLRHRAYLPLRQPILDGGHAFLMQLPQLAVPGDDTDDPCRSHLVVLEDGGPLGPAHTAHDIIRSKGGGAFSHWGGRLYFSTSDNTDPRCNGREYVAIVPR
jgi:glycosyltransferase involved in cell wall biosynthesis